MIIPTTYTQCNISALLYYQCGIHKQFEIRRQQAEAAAKARLASGAKPRRKSRFTGLLSFEVGKRTKSGRVVPARGREGAKRPSMLETDALRAALGE